MISELTRASLIGVNFRIARVYGASPLGARIALAYDRALGCRDSILERVVARPGFDAMPAFAPINGERVRVRRFSPAQREIRETAAREERAEYQAQTDTLMSRGMRKADKMGWLP